MSVVKINVLQVPEGRGDVLEQRFAARAGEVDTVDGFESFQLLRPTEGTDRYLVVTTWRDEASFQAWMSSAAFTRGHARSQADAEAPGDDTGPSSARTDHGGETEPGAHGGEVEPGAPAGGHPGGAAGHGGPAATGSELWGFEVVTSSTKA